MRLMCLLPGPLILFSVDPFRNGRVHYLVIPIKALRLYMASHILHWPVYLLVHYPDLLCALQNCQVMVSQVWGFWVYTATVLGVTFLCAFSFEAA